MSFWFGDFELDQERRQLLREGESVPLEPKAYELLSLLLERRPRALSRAQIRDAIWPSTFVSESTLAVVVNGIRHALSDDARQPRFIRTAHGYGYAFCGEARESREGNPAGHEGTRGEPGPSPYPGLSAFTERDAAVFFGREAEVEALWEKIRRRKLLALIGPSGVGKTSFLRAGVVPSRPSGWAVAYFTPGSSPLSALARALVPDLVGDADGIAELLRGVEELKASGGSDRVVAVIRRWRKASGEALVVVDQLEELFALNAPETQSAFGSLLGRLPEETGAHVLLSLRDDFLFSCGARAGLRSVFQDLTPLIPPSADALRRALVEPARRRGVRFEEDALVGEMVEPVASERAALPQLAFVALRLWEERDRERRLLTRDAYERMGGVAGALAQHAEATLAGLDSDRDGIVREIFRNLVTAQGTRAAVDRAELLSVFAERREEAGAVLDALVDARLLTEHEVEQGAAGHRRVEIVHESLLTHWPRLARWRTQDADGAQLRDQLRQAAHLWDERGRADDLLWTGTSYLDYRAWRARYAGGLTAVEEAFGRAMTRLAESQRRRRKAFAAAVVASLAVALTVVGIQWSRAVEARRRAQQEAQAAEAAKLLAMGQAELERSRTAAVAYVTKSLELADTEAARRFAVRALQDAPPASLVPGGSRGNGFVTAFSPDGEWLLWGGLQSARLYRRRGGGLIEAPVEPPPSYAGLSYGFSPRSDRLFGDRGGAISVWSLPDLREISHRQVSPPSSLFVRSRGVVTIAAIGGHETVSWSRLDDGDSRLLGEMEPADPLDVDANGERIAYVPPRPGMESSLFVRSLDDWRQPPRRLATHPAPIVSVMFDPTGRFVAAGDRSDRIRIWEVNGRSNVPARVLETKGVLDLRYSPGGRWLASAGVADTFGLSLWDLAAPAEVRPLRVPIETVRTGAWAIDPSDQWLATQESGSIALRAIGAGFPRLIGRHGWFVDDVAFAPDGSRLFSVAAGSDGTVRAWPMSPGSTGGVVVLRAAMDAPRIVIDPTGRWMAVADNRSVLVAPVAGGAARELTGCHGGVRFRAAAFSPDGRSLAAAPMRGPAAEKVVRVWDVESGRGRVVAALPGAGEDFAGDVNGLAFVDDARICASSSTAGVYVIDLRRGTTKGLLARPAAAVAFDTREHAVLAIVRRPDELVRIAADGRTTTVFPCPSCESVALDPSGSAVATGSSDGIVRIGPATGGDPHLFFARPSAAGQRVAFSPDGRWVASSGEAPSIHLWPVPDVSRRPLHRRPCQDVLDTLHSWTNVRAVRDPQSPTGWKLEAGPFPGWEKLPQR